MNCKKGLDVECTLLGLQVRNREDKVNATFPDKPVAGIDMRLYGMMKSKEVLQAAKGMMA